MSEDLTGWFVVVTDRIQQIDPDAFSDIDLQKALEQVQILDQFTSQQLDEPFSSRNTFGGSGQTDSS